MQSDTIINKINERIGYQYPVLIAITLLAAALRFYKLGEWSFWIDEIYTFTATEYLSEWPLIRLPVTLVLIKGSLNLFGASEWSARLIPAIIGTISIPAIYFFVRRLFDPFVGLISVLILAISTWHIFWSQNARIYILLLLFYTLAILLFYTGIEKKSWATLIISMFLVILAIRERLTSAYYFPVILTYVFTARFFQIDRQSSLSNKYYLLLFLPVGLFVFYDVYRVIFEGNASIIIHTWQIFAGKSNHSPLRLFFSIIYQIGIPLICLGFFAGLKVIFDKNKAGWYIFLGAIIPPILLVAISPFAFTVDRYVFISLPFWAILTAIALKDLLIRKGGNSIFVSIGVLITVVTFFLGQNYLYYVHQNGNRPDWRGAVELVRDHYEPGDIIAATWPELVDHYLGNNEVRSINRLTPASVIETDQRIWFLIDEATGWVEPGLYQWIKSNSQLIGIRNVHISGKSLSIFIYLHDPK